MTTVEKPRALAIVADLDILTPAGDRLWLRGDGGTAGLVATSVAALWRTRRAALPLLRSGFAPRAASRIRVDVDVRVGEHVVARVESSTLGGSRVRLRWLALLRALFSRTAWRALD
jgi:hypothetical protein